MTQPSGCEVLYCEFLSVRALVLTLVPSWLVARGRVQHCYYIDSAPVAARLIGLVSSLTGVQIERLDFRLAEVHDDEGQLIRLRLAYDDMRAVRDEVTRQPAFQSFVADSRIDDDQKAFLAKCVCSLSLTDRTTMWRTLLIQHVVAWHARRVFPDAARSVLLERRAWQDVVDSYGRALGLSVRSIAARFELSGQFRTWLAPHRLGWLRCWRDRIGHFLALRRQGASVAAARAAVAGDGLPLTGRPRILVEYLGHFHLKEPQFYSDLFFWQASELPGDDLVITFGVPQAPLEPGDHEALVEAHITPVVLYPGGATVPSVPLFTSTSRRRADILPAPASLEGKWLRAQSEFYNATKRYWGGLLQATNAQMFVAWNRFDNRMHPLAAALRERGGSTAIYQRSFQPDPAPEMAVRAEIVFGYSPMDARVESASGSEIDYHVSVGYSGDHRAPMLKGQAAKVRERLQSNGAKRIVAYFDENSGNDSRWHTGHEMMRENYDFILDRLLTDLTMGLVLKPKRPSTLRSRLGPLASKLERALASGRCYMYETGVLHGDEPPVAAALVADLAIHGHLCAATAGLEAALAGVPTLLLDREGWPKSAMFKLGSRVAFTDWPGMWSAVEEYWRSCSGVPGFGDWRPFIEELDPFRDGRAAERIGTYLDWVISGYRAGQTREVTLAAAAERYAARWGADKITRVTPAASDSTLYGASRIDDQHFDHAH